MTGWLFDTLVWTAALIALVLLLRRPVARHLGPQFAYALWALPFLRLVLPPVTLPAWLAPAAPVTVEPAVTAVALSTDPAMVAMPVDAGDAALLAAPVDLLPYALAAWLTGAAAFLLLRFNGYFAMRDRLLADAVPVGQAGTVRLVETPCATAPLAFGVIDKVIALPPGFMALHDKRSRDLALAHELAHHRGHDLLANFAVQPLFALHWFNPLAWLGWRAMRRDQEAACDARVVAGSDRSERAAYANVIASFAAGPEVSLAAPMACPVLGEKSIIHRLRSLSMSDISPRRRMAGRLFAGAALLAMPLTATITYAAPERAPVAPEAPLPPAAPRAPGAPLAPDAPTPPEAPRAPGSDSDFSFAFAGTDEDGNPTVVTAPVDEDVKVWVTRDKDGKEKRAEVRKKVVRSGDWESMSAKDRAELEAELGKLHKQMGDKVELQREIEQAMAEARRDRAEAMADARRARAEATASAREAREVRRVSVMEMQHGSKDATRVEVSCTGDEPVSERTTRSGKTIVSVCESKIYAQALVGLKEARKAIAGNREMGEDMRAEVLRTLDEQIRNWDDSQG